MAVRVRERGGDVLAGDLATGKRGGAKGALVGDCCAPDMTVGVVECALMSVQLFFGLEGFVATVDVTDEGARGLHW